MMKPSISVSGFVAVVVLCSCLFAPGLALGAKKELHFSKNGTFKILQVSDMHYGDNDLWPCQDILPEQYPCSNRNTSVFLERLIEAEKPDLIVFSGDNIFVWLTGDAAKAMDRAFAPAIKSGIPWVAILGNHDQESDLTREQLMWYIVSLNNTLSQVNPANVTSIDGFGNYNLEVSGVKNSSFENKSVLNLYFLDSGDYSFWPLWYDWIKPSQQQWFKSTSEKLQKEYMSKPNPQNAPAPGLVYFHIPIPEFADVNGASVVGDWHEKVGSPKYNSGFFATMVETGDVKAAFAGHDHKNDFCGEVADIQLCYAGGFGYKGYGKVGWPRRARVVLATLEHAKNGTRGAVHSITSWKRLDDANLSTIDHQVIWSQSGVSQSKKQISSLLSQDSGADPLRDWGLTAPPPPKLFKKILIYTLLVRFE